MSLCPGFPQRKQLKLDLAVSVNLFGVSLGGENLWLLPKTGVHLCICGCLWGVLNTAFLLSSSLERILATAIIPLACLIVKAPAVVLLIHLMTDWITFETSAPFIGSSLWSKTK